MIKAMDYYCGDLGFCSHGTQLMSLITSHQSQLQPKFLKFSVPPYG